MMYYFSHGDRANFAVAIADLMEKTIAASHFFILKVRSKVVLPEYLAWYINQSPAQSYLYNTARRGTHMPLVPKSSFENLKVHVPDIKTQKSIVELNRLLERENELIRKLQEKRTLLIGSSSIKAAKTGNY